MNIYTIIKKNKNLFIHNNNYIHNVMKIIIYFKVSILFNKAYFTVNIRNIY